MSNEDKLKCLVHYISHNCDNSKDLGATKLNKILWYVDTIAFQKYGKTISGEESYIKRQHGPVPKRIQVVLEKLRNEGALHIRMTENYGWDQKEFISLKDPEDCSYPENEKQLIDDMINDICKNHTAKSISQFSHDHIWEAARLGEEIPVYAVLAANSAPPSREDKIWAEQAIREYKNK